MRGRSLLAGLGLVSLVAGCGGGSDIPTAPSGGGNTVTVGNNFFSPISLSVPVNTAVTWSWANGASQHNVTFDDTAPGSGTMSSGTFARTFGTAGTYTYFCSIHGRAVMHGTITVTSSSATTGTGGATMGGAGGSGAGGGYGMP